MKTPTSNIPTIGPLYADDLQTKFRPSVFFGVGIRL